MYCTSDVSLFLIKDSDGWIDGWMDWLIDWNAGDAAVDAGSYRRSQSSDSRVTSTTRRRLWQASRSCVLLGTATTSRALLSQVSARVLQTDVSTARTGDSLRTTIPAAAATTDRISKYRIDISVFSNFYGT